MFNQSLYDTQSLDPCIESALIETIDSFPCIYILFGCRVCGLPWEDHKESCCEHKKKSKFIAYQQFAKRIQKYKDLFKLAVVNSWIDPEEASPAQNIDHVSWSSNINQVIE